ncbi:hypothetical protein CANCADRAFT_3009 [Tortispora caseinolytica NRRL Y-17796]|uniref:CAP-Gly domain-containing protein n=1 Tax=Tortispora caseinolytica NRRL Y-17796 TaxID=767744 RepID=A0A1E4TI00_9ASCO|nr:hypothetical protein CANCADRAFT_3009 [Tortispora caseinolytica NRRL Y-17796]
MTVVPINIRSQFANDEKRIDSTWSINQFKSKMEFITGIPPEKQQLALIHENTTATPLNDDNRTLQSYNLTPYSTIKITNVDGEMDFGQYSDKIALGMSDEQYQTRQDTVLAYKREHHIGRFATSDIRQQKEQMIIDQSNKLAAQISLNQRCMVDERIGTVAYIGTVEEIGPGSWIGVAFDNPVGKNNGSIKGHQYFECPPNHGSFVRPDRLSFQLPEPTSNDLDEI